MNRGDRQKPYSNKGAVIAYVKMKEARNRYTCTIDYLGNCFYNVEGHRVPENVFNEMFPIGLLNRNTKGEGIGVQKIFS